MVSTTSAFIAIETNEGIVATHIQHGGNILNTGRVLLANYLTEPEVLGLLTAGQIKFLRMNSVEKMSTEEDWPISLKNKKDLLKKITEQEYMHVYLFDKISQQWLYLVKKKNDFVELRSLLD